MTDKINLFNHSRKQLEFIFKEIGEKPFHARQLIKWIHQKGIINLDEMTDLGKNLRQKLKDNFELKPPKIAFEKSSLDGTRKWLIDTEIGGAVETVFIPDGNRGTLCISSEIGCMLNCSFCSTAKQGFNRNLSVAEIIGQVWHAARALSEKDGEHDHKITNIVMMGMGEPLMNFDNVVAAMDIMMDDLGYGLARRRTTLSTSGVVPNIYKLLEQDNIVSLAVSLHAPTDDIRDELVPINKRYNIDMLLDACNEYAKKGPHKHITIGYTLINDVNDRLKDAENLALLLKNKQTPCKINLIPFNPYPGTKYQRPSNNRVHTFKRIMMEHGFIVTIRKTRGDDIDAACGQLVGNVNDKTKRQERYQQTLGK